MPTCRTEQLENGLRLLWLDVPSVHNVYLGAFVPGGSAYEKAEHAGVSHLLEHLHLSTTRSHPDRTSLARALDSCMGYVNGETHLGAISFDLAVSPRHLVAAAELLAEILETREFEKSVVDDERKLIRSELDGAGDSFQCFLRAFFPKTAMVVSNSRQRKAVKRLRLETIYEYQRRLFAPQRMVVTVVGNIATLSIEAVRDAFSALPPGTSDLPDVNPLWKPSLPIVRSHGAWSFGSEVYIGFVVDKPISVRDRVCHGFLTMAMDSISSPVMNDVRYVASHVYHFAVGGWYFGDMHFFLLQAQLRNCERNAFLKCILQHCADLRTKPMPESWFENTKDRMLYNLEWLLDYPTQAGQYLGLSIVEGGVSEDDLLAKEHRAAQELTSQDVQAYATSLFQFQRLCCIVPDRALPFDIARIRNMARNLLS